MNVYGNVKTPVYGRKNEKFFERRKILKSNDV
jgi:hypothetical protein